MQATLHPPSVYWQSPPAYEEVPSGQAIPTGSSAPPKTWRDLELMLYRSGISPTPEHPHMVTTEHQRGLANHIITSALILASNRPEVERDVGGLVHEFDEAWLEMQRAAYLFYSNSAALRRCGNRLYALQERYYTAGRFDMAVAIDPILEAVDARMPEPTPISPALAVASA